MTDPNSSRPRAKTMVGLDLDNAYARLGVSPLLPTDEIKEVINRKRRESMRRRRTRADQQFGEEEAEMTVLQAIEDEIGTAKARAQYDRLNPQNILLTIQGAPGDACFDSGHRSGIVTAWLVEQLGRDIHIASAESLALWAPRGLDPEVLALLAAFLDRDDGAAKDRIDEATLPDVAELEHFGIEALSRGGPQAAGEAIKKILASAESEGGLPNG